MKTDGYTVYVHINKSNGKRYVGITSKAKPEHRWNSGRGYKENPYFYSAILKYGWDGFDHIIVANNLTDADAMNMERTLISKWKSNDREYGYNMTSGGEGSPGYIPGEETRKKLSEARKREISHLKHYAEDQKVLKGESFQINIGERLGTETASP